MPVSVLSLQAITVPGEVHKVQDRVHPKADTPENSWRFDV